MLSLGRGGGLEIKHSRGCLEVEKWGGVPLREFGGGGPHRLSGAWEESPSGWDLLLELFWSGFEEGRTKGGKGSSLKLSGCPQLDLGESRVCVERKPVDFPLKG